MSNLSLSVVLLQCFKTPLLSLKIWTSSIGSADNVARLMTVLEGLDAHFRASPRSQKLRPRASDFMGRGHILLRTSLGKLDVLCEVIGNRSYEQLLAHSIELEDNNLRFRILDLPMLIRLKTEVNRPKDRLMLPILLATLEERRREE